MILSENMMLFILFVVWKINMDIKTGIDTINAYSMLLRKISNRKTIVLKIRIFFL